MLSAGAGPCEEPEDGRDMGELAETSSAAESRRDRWLERSGLATERVRPVFVTICKGAVPAASETAELSAGSKGGEAGKAYATAFIGFAESIVPKGGRAAADW